tara:strand:- start:196 stop:357 length:162 start_codon:yes stop_codon:yes gene_type:complete
MLLFIVIGAFFILGIEFFVFGNDVVGVTRLKEDPRNTSIKETEISTSNQLAKT